MINKEMKNVKVKKTWKGCVSVRDYIVKKAIKEGAGLIVEYNGEKMTISHEQLPLGKKSRKTFISQIDGKYKLIDYKWRPDCKLLF